MRPKLFRTLGAYVRSTSIGLNLETMSVSWDYVLKYIIVGDAGVGKVCLLCVGLEAGVRTDKWVVGGWSV